MRYITPLSTGGSGTPDDGSVTTTKVAAATLVTAADTIAANDNDTTLPTSAAVKDYADSVGGGDVVGPASSVDSEIALFDSTTGKLLKRATQTGILKAASGVVAAATAGTDYYNPGGTDVAIGDGGTGASLTDPNADRVMFWDDSAGAVTWLTPGTNLSISGTTLNATTGGGGTVNTVVAGTNIDVDATDPANPIVSVESLTPADIGLAATVTELDYVDGVTSAIQPQLDGKQASDADLTAIAGLTPTNDDVIQRKSGAWTNRTMAQVKTDLALVKGDVGLGNVDNTSNATERAAARTLTNARITKRAYQVSNDITFDIDTDLYDYAENTGLTGNPTITWSGTPTLGQTLWVSLTGTASRPITWDSDFEASDTVALPTTTSGTARLDVGFVWNAATSKLRCVAVA